MQNIQPQHNSEVTNTPLPRIPRLYPLTQITYIPAMLEHKREPGVGEALWGCGTLLAISIIVLILLFYLIR